MDKVIVTGIQPTGKLHIGNYLGLLVNLLDLQNKYLCYIFVADMHSLMENYRPQEKRQQILDVVIDLLALGLDPDKCVIFVQSQVPEHAELAWYFNTLTPIAFLERMTQYKDKMEQQKNNINAGLLSYPILQAADILLYKPFGVPVGEDQIQHLELVNDIVKKFNSKFGQTFTPIKPLLTKTPRLMSILDPTKKMSKSLGDRHVINLGDEPDVIEKKLNKAVTDTGKTKTMSAGTENLFTLLEIFGEPAQMEFYKEAHKTGTIRYADLKANLAKVIAHHFTMYRQKRRDLEKNPEYLMGVIATGREKARAVASQTLAEVKEKMGLLL
jgi:tryptophanyl-tRNA synthetase